VAIEFRMLTVQRNRVNKRPILPGTKSTGRRKLFHVTKISNPEGAMISMMLRAIFLLSTNSKIKAPFISGDFFSDTLA